MKVYILKYNMSYEGFDIDGIFDSYDKAQKKMYELILTSYKSRFGEWEIVEYDVL